MSEYSNEEIVDRFLDHIRYLHIAHHVSGRIRVKASWQGARQLANVDRRDITLVIAKIPGISDYRVNKKALSVIIEYDPEILPYQLWQDVGSLGECPMNRDRVRSQLLELLQADR